MRNTRVLVEPERIRSFREKWGMSQAKFADMLDVSTLTIVKWERVGITLSRGSSYALLAYWMGIDQMMEEGVLPPSFAELVWEAQHRKIGARRSVVDMGDVAVPVIRGGVLGLMAYLSLVGLRARALRSVGGGPISVPVSGEEQAAKKVSEIMVGYVPRVLRDE